jgi:hypothetical protein
VIINARTDGMAASKSPAIINRMRPMDIRRAG